VDKIHKLQKQCQQDGKCGNVVVTTTRTVLVAHIGKLTLILSDLILARIHGGIFVISVEQAHQVTLTKQIISGAVSQLN
jgi:hypothetical protein